MRTMTHDHDARLMERTVLAVLALGAVLSAGWMVITQVSHLFAPLALLP